MFRFCSILLVGIVLISIQFFVGGSLPNGLIWILLFVLFLSFTTSANKRAAKQQDFQIQSRKREEYETLCDLYQEAFVHNDFESLQKLAKEYCAGNAADYWKDYPDIRQKIAQAIKKLAEVVESDNAPREPELEDFWYMGLMYEFGFECEPDLNKAIESFEKALDTKTCWSHLGDENTSLRIKVEKELRQINSWLSDMQFKGKSN